MTEHDARNIDKAIAVGWSDIRVAGDLKTSTLAAIHAAQHAQATGDETAQNPPSKTVSITALCSEMDKTTPRQFKRRRNRLAAGLVAAILFLTFIGVGANIIYHTETASAQVKSEATVTLGVNRFSKVVRATAAQEDSQDEVDSLGLKGTDYDTAMTTLAESGYLGSGDIDVEVDANADDQKQTLVETTSVRLEDAGFSGTCNGRGYGKHNGEGGSSGNGSNLSEEDHSGGRHGNGNGNGNAGS